MPWQTLVAGGISKTFQLAWVALRRLGGVICLVLIVFILISFNGTKAQPPRRALGNRSQLCSSLKSIWVFPVKSPGAESALGTFELGE